MKPAEGTEGEDLSSFLYSNGGQTLQKVNGAFNTT